jgi:hypothetical protein
VPLLQLLPPGSFVVHWPVPSQKLPMAQSLCAVQAVLQALPLQM